MCSLSALFSARLMLFVGNNGLIGAPKIRITGSLTIRLWKRLPEFATGDFATIPDHECDNLTSLPAERKPNPALFCFLAHKRPEFIQLECDTTRIARNRWNKSLCERLQRLDFFLTSQSPYYAQHRTSVPIRVSYYVLDRLAGSFLAVLLNRPLYRDFHGFAGDRFDRGTFASRLGQYRIL